MMIPAFLTRLIIIAIGTLYPAYRSFKAIRSKNAREYLKWMMYWIVFGIFGSVELLADVFIAFWLPFYSELKVLFVLWLFCPWTNGASILYKSLVHPLMVQNEAKIDRVMNSVKAKIYRQLMDLGSYGLSFARDMVVSAALRSRVRLGEQLPFPTSDANGFNQQQQDNDDNLYRPPRVRVSLFEQAEEELAEPLDPGTANNAGHEDNVGRGMKDNALRDVVDDDFVIIEGPQPKVATNSSGPGAIKPKKTRGRPKKDVSRSKSPSKRQRPRREAAIKAQRSIRAISRERLLTDDDDDMS